jgi:acylphosphatase
VGRLHLIIKGRVQGVFFRVRAQEVAEELGLSGVVRNRPDGSVELVAEGADEKLSRLRDWAKRGPSEAHVSFVDEISERETGEFSDFRIR